jgi:predicted amidophosphoribosyltransferase
MSTYDYICPVCHGAFQWDGYSAYCPLCGSLLVRPHIDRKAALAEMAREAQALGLYDHCGPGPDGLL